jgi:murein DD-endopeptidase MepM/ murein hydrolase activator NlpD
MSSPFRRREVLAGGAALLALAPVARAFGAPDAGITLSGEAAQGGLIIGDAGAAREVWIDNRLVRIANGKFCFGFPYDATLPVAVRVRLLEPPEAIREVVPAKRNFVVQRINGLPEKFVTPSPEELARIRRDAEAVGEARAIDSGESWFAESFDWPADGPITGIYGSQRILNGEPRAPHYGVDIAAGEGSPIRAPKPGIVTLAEFLFLSGNTMIIDHGHGVSTTYLHMSRMDVKPGQRLDRGEPIGLIGHTGRATGPHLCWRLNWFQTRLDVALVAPPRPGDRAHSRPPSGGVSRAIARDVRARAPPRRR